jgi:hypothetical protein
MPYPACTARGEGAMAGIPSWQDIRDRFHRGALAHPDFAAHWDSRQNVWTFRNASEGEFENPADPEPECLFKEIASIAVSSLGKLSTQKAYESWLDLMREGNRGFRRILKPRGWSEFKRLTESGGPPVNTSDVPLANDGTIAHVFKESAEFCEDLAARANTSCASHEPHHLRILKTAMDHKNWNPPKLAAAIQVILKRKKGRWPKVDRTTVYRIIAGETKKPQPAVRNALIEALELKGKEASIVQRGLGGLGAIEKS